MIINREDCKTCIFPMLRGCPVLGSYHNAACLAMYKSRDTCKAEDCEKCKWKKYCDEAGITLNNIKKEN